MDICKGRPMFGGQHAPCHRVAVNDGYCLRHHPEHVAERNGLRAKRALKKEAILRSENERRIVRNRMQAEAVTLIKEVAIGSSDAQAACRTFVKKLDAWGGSLVS